MKLPMDPARRSALVKIAIKVSAGLAFLVGAPLLGILLSRSRDAAASAALAEASASAGAAVAQTTAQHNDYVAVLLPPQMANLSPKADGRVLSVRVKSGQAVREGDVLVSFDPREREHDLEMAEAALGVAKAEAGGAGAAYSAARRQLSMLHGKVTVAGRSYDLSSGLDVAKAEADMQTSAATSASAGAKIKEAKAKVAQLRLALEETELRAPYEGIVTAVNFEPGATAHTGDTVVRIVGRGTGLRARIAIPEDSAELAQRKRAKLVVDGRTFLATIDQRPVEVEPASRTYVIEGNVDLTADVCGSDCSLLAGRAARASMLKDGSGG